MIFPNSKLSQGHVEMIISLALFVGAVLFIFIFINPFTNNQETLSYIKNVEREILNNISGKVGKLSIISTDDNGCYNFNENEYKKLFSENDFSKVNYIESLESSVPGKYKYSIYFSDMFETTIEKNKKSSCDKKDYTLSSYYDENFVINEKIKELKTNYEADYGLLKKNLRINRDFSFSVKENENSLDIEGLSVVKKSSAGVERESEFVPIIIMDKSGNIKQLMFNIKVW
jgi:hypothetical protein